MKKTTKLAAWAGAVALLTTPAAYAAPTHVADSLNPSAGTELAEETSDDEITPFIIGGEKAKIKDWPFLAKVRVYEPKEEGATKRMVGHCGGFIVSKNIVVTAQHCVDEPYEYIKINYGHSKWTKGKKAKTKPENVRMGSGIKRGDWAVLKFDEPLDIDESELIAMANHSGFNEGPTFKAAGWGRTTPEEGSKTKYLRQVEMDFISDELCGAGRSDICAGDWKEGGKSTCNGDSGGPLVREVAGIPVAVGITSWHPKGGCARAEKPTRYTEISTYWGDIVGAIDALDGDRPNLAPDW